MTYLLAAESSGVTNQVIETTSGIIGVAWLIPVVPLLGFVAVLVARRWLGDGAALIGIGAAAVAFVLSLAVALPVLSDPNIYLRPRPTWIEAGELSVGFDLFIDQLTVVMLLVVTGVGLLVHVYSVGYMHGDGRYARFFAYLNLFMAMMLVLVVADSLPLMFVGWEGVGLCSYLLIGFWYQRPAAARAALKAFWTTKAGDVGLLIGIVLLWRHTGTFDFFELRTMAESGAIALAGLSIITFCIYLGAVGKSAQFPLHVWLPDAMEGPTPVSALIHAATMVTAGVYLIARMHPLFEQAPIAVHSAARRALAS